MAHSTACDLQILKRKNLNFSFWYIPNQITIDLMLKNKTSMSRLMNMLCTFPIVRPAANGIDVSLWSSVDSRLFRLAIAIPLLYLSLFV